MANGPTGRGNNRLNQSQASRNEFGLESTGCRYSLIRGAFAAAAVMQVSVIRFQTARYPVPSASGFDIKIAFKIVVLLNVQLVPVALEGFQIYHQ